MGKLRQDRAVCLALHGSTELLIPPCITLALPRPGLRSVPPDELSMAQKVLVWSGPYQGPASRSFSTGAGAGGAKEERENKRPAAKGRAGGEIR